MNYNGLSLKNCFTSVATLFFSSAKFDQMKDCVVKVVKYCANSLPDSTIRRIVDDSFLSKECSEGPALISSSSAASPLCSSSFVTKANACGRTFRQIFVADKSNSSLCAWVCVNYLFSHNKLNLHVFWVVVTYDVNAQITLTLSTLLLCYPKQTDSMMRWFYSE